MSVGRKQEDLTFINTPLDSNHLGMILKVFYKCFDGPFVICCCPDSNRVQPMNMLKIQMKLADNAAVIMGLILREISILDFTGALFTNELKCLIKMEMHWESDYSSSLALYFDKSAKAVALEYNSQLCCILYLIYV